MEKFIGYVVAGVLATVAIAMIAKTSVDRSRQDNAPVKLTDDTVNLQTSSLMANRFEQDQQFEAQKAAAADSFARSLGEIAASFEGTNRSISDATKRIEDAAAALSVPVVDIDLLADKVSSRVEGNIIARMNALFAEQNDVLAKNYKQPTLEEIATAVAARVSGTSKVNYSTPTMQNPGVITHIDGVPVRQSATYPSLNQPIYSAPRVYRAPTYYYRGSVCGPGGCR